MAAAIQYRKQDDERFESEAAGWYKASESNVIAQNTTVTCCLAEVKTALNSIKYIEKDDALL